jgi:DNA-binding MarR family transcriptional regulator
MPHRAAPDQTPAGHLSEAGLQGILGYQLAQARLTTQAVYQATVGQPQALRPVEFTILALVDHNPDVTARQLARALAVAPPNLTTWLERLEQRGLVARVRSETDRRSQHVRATAAGTRLARETARQVIAAEALALESLSPAERALLLELLHKVAARRPR